MKGKRLRQRRVGSRVAHQSFEHTLTDAEVQRERRRILERLSRQVGAELRG